MPSKSYPDRFFPDADEARIVAAIRAFERRTSGEIRVHVERHLRRPPVDEAVRVFERLGMDATAQRNGVLILLAPGERAFAIVGDAGINAVTGPGFWDGARDAMRPHFAAGDYVAGLEAGIALAGEALATHFPLLDDDVNELPDDISYG